MYLLNELLCDHSSACVSLVHTHIQSRVKAPLSNNFAAGGRHTPSLIHLRPVQASLPCTCHRCVLAPAGGRHTPRCQRIWCWAELRTAHCPAAGKPDLPAHAPAQRGSSSAAIHCTHAAQRAALQLFPDATGGCYHNSSWAVWGRACGVLPGDGRGCEAQRKGGMPGSSCCSKGGCRSIQGGLASCSCIDVTEGALGTAAAEVGHRADAV